MSTGDPINVNVDSLRTFLGDDIVNSWQNGTADPQVARLMALAYIEKIHQGTTITEQDVQDAVAYFCKGQDQAEAYNLVLYGVAHNGSDQSYTSLFNGSASDIQARYAAAENVAQSALPAAPESQPAAPAYTSQELPSDVKINAKGNFDIFDKTIDVSQVLRDAAFGNGSLDELKTAVNWDNQWGAWVADKLGIVPDGASDKLKNAATIIDGIDKVFENSKNMSQDQKKALVSAYEKIFAEVNSALNPTTNNDGTPAVQKPMDIPANDLLLIAATAGKSFTQEQWQALYNLLPNDASLDPKVKEIVKFMASNAAQDPAMAATLQKFDEAALAYASLPADASAEQKADALAKMTEAMAPIISSDAAAPLVSSMIDAFPKPDNMPADEYALVKDIIHNVSDLSAEGKTALESVVADPEHKIDAGALLAILPEYIGSPVSQDRIDLVNKAIAAASPDGKVSDAGAILSQLAPVLLKNPEVRTAITADLSGKALADINTGDMLQAVADGMSKATDAEKQTIANSLTDIIANKMFPASSGTDSGTQPDHNKTKEMISDVLMHISELSPEEVKELTAAIDSGDKAKILEAVNQDYMREPAKEFHSLPSASSYDPSNAEQVAEIQKLSERRYGVKITAEYDADGDGKVDPDKYQAWLAAMESATRDEVSRRAAEIQGAVGENAGGLSFLNSPFLAPFAPFLIGIVGMFNPEMAKEMQAAMDSAPGNVDDIMRNPDGTTIPVGFASTLENGGELTDVDVAKALTGGDISFSDLAPEDRLVAALELTGHGDEAKAIAKLAADKTSSGDAQTFSEEIKNAFMNAGDQASIMAELAKLGVTLGPDEVAKISAIMRDGPSQEMLDVIIAKSQNQEVASGLYFTGDEVKGEIGSKGNQHSVDGASYSFHATSDNPVVTEADRERVEVNSLIALGSLTHGIEILASEKGLDKDSLMAAIFTGIPSLESLGLSESDIQKLAGDSGVTLTKTGNSYSLQHDGVSVDLSTVHGWENGQINLFMAGMADRLNEHGYNITVSVPEAPDLANQLKEEHRSTDMDLWNTLFPNLSDAQKGDIDNALSKIFMPDNVESLGTVEMASLGNLTPSAPMGVGVERGQEAPAVA